MRVARQPSLAGPTVIARPGGAPRAWYRPAVVGAPDKDETLDDAAARRMFDAMVAEHLPGLRLRAAQLCRGHADADDVIQDALLRAFRVRHQLREVTHTRGWLLTIVTNTFIDLVRRRRARREHADADLAPAAEPVAPTAEPSPAWHDVSVDDVHAAVAQLPDDVRDTYRMFALEGKDYQTIAAAQGVAEATIGTRIHRARAQLRALLAPRLREATS